MHGIQPIDIAYQAIIQDYAMNVLGDSQAKANQIYEKLARHPDILAEFAGYIQNNTFPQTSPITVEGITAEQLTKMTYLTPLGAYNYLIRLREKPQEALADLAAGLPNKDSSPI